MQCRPHCGACCIAISIVTPFYGMPAGKPAGEPCIHLSPDMACRLFGDARRPALCSAFAPQAYWCGDKRAQALERLAQLERDTLPASGQGCRA